MQEAKQLLFDNSLELGKIEDSYGANLGMQVLSEIKRNVELNRAQSAVIDDKQRWKASRKGMVEEQTKNSNQQNLRVKVPSSK